MSTGLTVWYSFRSFCFALCGDFNFVSSYSVVETSYNVVLGIMGRKDYINEKLPRHNRESSPRASSL